MAARPPIRIRVALWRAHIERALRAAKTLKAGCRRRGSPCAIRSRCARSWRCWWSRPSCRRRRADEAHRRRLRLAGVMVPANFRIDAWVSPPTYTGRPPVILQGLRPGEPVQTAANLSVPAAAPWSSARPASIWCRRQRRE
jgi:hypothetical protein